MTGTQLQHELNIRLKGARGDASIAHLMARTVHKLNVWLYKRNLHRRYGIKVEGRRIFLLDAYRGEKLNEICLDIMRGAQGGYGVYNVIVLSADGGRPLNIQERGSCAPSRGRTRRTGSHYRGAVRR